MTQLTNNELFLMLGAVVFAVIFFVIVSISIALFFKRLQRQDSENLSSEGLPDDKPPSRADKIMKGDET